MAESEQFWRVFFVYCIPMWIAIKALIELISIRRLLEAWYRETGCPILLNTSLNVRGEPMVNDRSDADRFEKLYGVHVIS